MLITINIITTWLLLFPCLISSHVALSDFSSQHAIWIGRVGDMPFGKGSLTERDPALWNNWCPSDNGGPICSCLQGHKALSEQVTTLWSRFSHVLRQQPPLLCSSPSSSFSPPFLLFLLLSSLNVTNIVLSPSYALSSLILSMWSSGVTTIILTLHTKKTNTQESCRTFQD